MKILSIESSCDETSAAVVEQNSEISVLSNVTATSLAIHAKTGGIIPENAAREQVKYIIPTITHALLKSEGIQQGNDKENYSRAKKILDEKIDAIAVTYGPGLIGSLLVGVETAKTLSYIFKKPLIPVNHLLAHLFANFIENKEITFPFIGLIVSGGHTDLLYFKNVTNYEWLGGTRDDAAGEALDKTGRILGLSYPAGAEIEQRAKQNINSKLRFHSPLLGVETFDFSFSGLKSEASRFIKRGKLNSSEVNDVCFAVQIAIHDVLIRKTLNAALAYNCSTIVLGGGVSANQTLIEKLREKAGNSMKVYSPKKEYCTDNAAMIGAFALLNPKDVSWKKVNANPELYFS